MRLPNPASPHSQQVARYHHAGDEHNDYVHDHAGDDDDGHDHDRDDDEEDDDDDDYDDDDDDDDQAELLLGRVLATNDRAKPARGPPSFQ